MATKPARKPQPAEASGGFEATCPTCGMTADVTAQDTHVRCKGCGTVIELVDHPVDAAPTAAPGVMPVNDGEPNAERAGLGIVIGLVAPILVAIAFYQGHNAIDQPEPDMGGGGFWFITCLLMAAGTVFAMWTILSPRVGAFAPWGLFALVPTVWFALVSGTSYADEDLGEELGFLFVAMPLMVGYYVAMLIVLAVRGRRAVGAVMAGGAGAAAGFGLAAAYLLSTLQHQADEARRAHQESPMVQAVAVALLLLSLAAWRRRP